VKAERRHDKHPLRVGGPDTITTRNGGVAES
jgi:hypothetical protein